MRAFLVAMETFTPQEMRDLRTVFDVYDPSKSGHVTLKDFRKVHFAMHNFAIKFSISRPASIPPSRWTGIMMPPQHVNDVMYDCFYCSDSEYSWI